MFAILRIVVTVIPKFREFGMREDKEIGGAWILSQT